MLVDRVLTLREVDTERLAVGDVGVNARCVNGLAAGPSSSGEINRIGAARTALEKERKLHIAYRDKYGADSDRTVWPAALGFFDGTELRAAWCESRRAFRHFRLDRIASIDILPDRLPAPRRILLAEYRI